MSQIVDSKTLDALLLSAATTFVGVMTAYVVITGRDPVNRLGFAVFTSLLPAVPALIIAWLYRFTPRGAVVTYLVLLLMTVTIQGWLR